MSDTSKKIKSIIKNTAPKSTFGTNPNDPWSAKAGLAEAETESNMLHRYLNSRGINPKFVSKDTKISHSKSAEFAKWKNDHQFDDPRDTLNSVTADKIQKEEIEQIDELKKTTVFSWLKQQPVVPEKKPGMSRKDHNQRIKIHNKNWNSALDRLSGYKPTSEETVSEETDAKDMICMDIPLLIRVLEFTREEMSSDIELHNMVERLINMRHDVPLDMTHYDEITKKLVKENHIAIAMGKMLDDEGGMVLTQIEELERGCAMIRSYIGKDYEKQLPAWVQAKVTLATDYMSTVGNYLVSKNEKVTEDYAQGVQGHLSQSTLDSIKNKRNVKVNLGTPTYKPKPKVLAKKPAKKSSFLSRLLNREETELDEAEKSALEKFRQASAERAKKHDAIEKQSKEKPGDSTSAIDRLEKHLNKEDYSKKAEMSKSARMIKSLYKKHGMKEELYDWEKEDKSVATYGKKPKTMKTDVQQSFGDNAPQAAAVLTGGKTLTGQTRDTLEIDPMMRKPSRPDGKQTDK